MAFSKPAYFALHFPTDLETAIFPLGEAGCLESLGRYADIVVDIDCPLAFSFEKRAKLVDELGKVGRTGYFGRHRLPFTLAFMSADHMTLGSLQMFLAQVVGWGNVGPRTVAEALGQAWGITGYVPEEVKLPGPLSFSPCRFFDLKLLPDNGEGSGIRFDLWEKSMRPELPVPGRAWSVECQLLEISKLEKQEKVADLAERVSMWAKYSKPTSSPVVLRVWTAEASLQGKLRFNDLHAAWTQAIRERKGVQEGFVRPLMERSQAWVSCDSSSEGEYSGSASSSMAGEPALTRADSKRASPVNGSPPSEKADVVLNGAAASFEPTSSEDTVFAESMAYWRRECDVERK